MLVRRYGINKKTVAKWKKRGSVCDLPTGPKQPHSTLLSLEEEAAIVAFRCHTLLSLDDCLYALQPTRAPHTVFTAPVSSAPRDHLPGLLQKRMKSLQIRVATRNHQSITRLEKKIRQRIQVRAAHNPLAP